MLRIPSKYINWESLGLKRNPRIPIVIPYSLYWCYRLLKNSLLAESLVCDKNRIMWDNEYLRHKLVRIGGTSYDILSYEIMKVKGKDSIVIWIDPKSTKLIK